MDPVSITTTLQNRLPNNGKFYLVAIDGRGGSGKSTLATELAAGLPGFTVLNGDEYFEPTPGELAWGAFNDERFDQEVIRPLQTSRTFVYRPYDWHASPHITDRPVTIDRGFMLERSHIFGLDLPWDLKIWVETPKSVCLERALVRETLPCERVLRVWQEVWQPAEDAYIASYHPKRRADIVVDGTRPFLEQLVA